MLKCAGCAIVLLAAAGMSYTLNRALLHSLSQLEGLLELHAVFEAELSYCRYPLPEMLQHLSAHVLPSYERLLAELGKCMEENREADAALLWKEACGKNKRILALPPEGYAALCRMGEMFCYHSMDAALELLRLNSRNISRLLEDGRSEYKNRKKVYCSICCMAGLFVVILLW